MEFYLPMSDDALSQRKLEEYYKFNKVIKWGRENPIRFVEHFFGVKLFDYQKWCFMESWDKPFVLWLMCRAAGKSSLLAVYLQAKMLLIPDYTVYISTLTAEQSIETFKKLEDLALQRIPSFKTCTDLFANEISKSANSETGFLHDKGGHSFRLFNNSQLKTLSSNINALRGKRGAVCYDESAWQTDEVYSVLDNYPNVDSNFGLGVDKNIKIDPIQMPLQLLYCSSAGDVIYPFYNKYKTFSKKMFLGDKNYFVCDLNVNTLMYHTTVDGEPTKSHITQEMIDKQVEEDPDRAEREVFNRFRKGSGIDGIVSMDTLIKNSSTRIPMLQNDGKSKFIFCYDPARNFDNSILSIFKIVENKDIGYSLQLENIISMVDQESLKKTPLPMPEQIKIIKREMIAYNGEKAADWENIEAFYIDAGAGGGGKSAVADSLVADWVDDTGRTRKGIVDKDNPQYETMRRNNKNAMPIVKLLEPTAYKKLSYSALERMLKFDLINFFDYDNKENLTLVKSDGTYDTYKLSDKERMILIQNNLLKAELSYMCRYENSNGGVQYELSSDKKNKMHDDRADTCSFAAYALAEMRRESLSKIPHERINPSDIVKFRQPQIYKNR